MARQLSLVSATLITAAVAGLMPTVADHIGSPPPPPQTIMPVPALPSTAPTATVPGAISVVSRASGSLPTNTSLEVPQSGVAILNLDASTQLAFRSPDGAWSQIQTVHPLFRNSTDNKKTIAITLLAQDRTGQEVTCLKLDRSGFSVPAHSAGFLPMSLHVCDGELPPKPAYPLHGFARLIVTPIEKTRESASAATSEPGVAFVPFSVLDPPAGGCAMTLTFLVPLALSLGVVLITVANLRRKGIHLKNRMGNTTWNFAQSWGANIAIAGALLGAVLTATIFPDHPHLINRNSYTMLQALFAAIIALAPLVYALIRYNVTAISNGVVSTDTQGYVIMFLISGALVLWGAIGQVAILGMLLLELIKSRTLPAGVGSPLLTLAALLGFFLIIYGLRSLYQTAKELSVPAAVVTGPPLPFPLPEGTRLTPEHAANLTPPLRVWPIL